MEHEREIRLRRSARSTFYNVRILFISATSNIACKRAQNPEIAITDETGENQKGKGEERGR